MGQILLPNCVYFLCFMFHTWVYDDIVTSKISEKLKFDYLKTEESFQSEIKNIFLVSHVPSFELTK